MDHCLFDLCIWYNSASGMWYSYIRPWVESQHSMGPAVWPWEVRAIFMDRDCGFFGKNPGVLHAWEDCVPGGLVDTDMTKSQTPGGVDRKRPQKALHLASLYIYILGQPLLATTVELKDADQPSIPSSGRWNRHVCWSAASRRYQAPRQYWASIICYWRCVDGGWQRWWWRGGFMEERGS